MSKEKMKIIGTRGESEGAFVDRTNGGTGIGVEKKRISSQTGLTKLSIPSDGATRDMWGE